MAVAFVIGRMQHTVRHYWRERARGVAGSRVGVYSAFGARLNLCVRVRDVRREHTQPR